MYIFIFGDSITYGACDYEKGGWADRLKLQLKKQNDNIDVYNLGVIKGDVSGDVLKRFEAELKSRTNKNDEALIIFAIGINDSIYLVKENKHLIPINEFNENIKKLITQARKYTKNIIFIGLTPVDKKKTSPIPWNTNMIYNNIYIERYNSALKDICQKEKIKFVDLYAKLIKLDYKKLLEDGLHPNSRGHEWMAEKISQSL